MLNLYKFPHAVTAQILQILILRPIIIMIIAEKCCTFFTNVGKKYASEIPKAKHNIVIICVTQIKITCS